MVLASPIRLAGLLEVSLGQASPADIDMADTNLADSVRAPFAGRQHRCTARQATAILALMLTIIASLLAGCGVQPTTSADYGSEAGLAIDRQEAPEAIYRQALEELKSGNYRRAAERFSVIEKLHPYSALAARAQLNAGFAYFSDENYTEAALTAERFVELHPTNENIAYARYLLAMSYYEQIYDTKRDQAATQRAVTLFEQLIRQFPDTTYAKDAQKSLTIARSNLAGHHMEIGRYYQQVQEYAAAINRFTTVIKGHEGTNHVPEALLRLAECYMAVGIVPEAQRVTAVLAHNFPESSWYRDAYALLKEFNALPLVKPATAAQQDEKPAVEPGDGLVEKKPIASAAPMPADLNSGSSASRLSRPGSPGSPGSGNTGLSIIPPSPAPNDAASVKTGPTGLDDAPKEDGLIRFVR